jgi:hypothetical protein
MCVPLQKRDPRARRMMIFGNLSLAAAIMIWNFTSHGGNPLHVWLHALCGLLFGISIGANLSGLLLIRRCRAGSM